jgi:hypothetical protein
MVSSAGEQVHAIPDAATTTRLRKKKEAKASKPAVEPVDHPCWYDELIGQSAMHQSLAPAFQCIMLYPMHGRFSAAVI